MAKEKQNETRTSIDELNDTLTNVVEEKVQNNKKTIITAILAVVVIAAAVIFFLDMRQESANAANDAIGQADMSLAQGNDSIALVQYMQVADNEGYGIKISGNFSFCASEYDIHNITEARHICELNKSNSVFIYTDFYMSGVGSKSVGGQVPDLNERINAGDEINFELIIKPYNTNQEDRL